MFRKIAGRLAIITAVAALQIASRGTADTILVAPHDAPQYRLSNLRIEDDQFGKANVVFDYKRTREGKGQVQLAGHNENGPIRFTFSPNLNRASGEVRFEKSLGSRGGGYNYEFYFVTPAGWAGKSYGKCLVSNSVRVGNPGSRVSARRWNAEEQAAYDKQQLADTAPSDLPEGYDAVDPSTTLVAGMPVKAGRYSEWVDAEVLALVPPSEVTIRYGNETTAETVSRDGWLAVDPEVRRRAEATPNSFKPSMRVLPGGRHPLPRDAVAIDPDLELYPGTPLLLRRGADWEEVHVRDDMGVTINVQYLNHSGDFTWEHKRTELAIRRKTLDELSRPGAAERFAKNADSAADFDEREITLGGEGPWGRQGGDTYHIHDRRYPIRVRIPSGAVLVPEDVELPEGVPVAYCWARAWQAATLVADRGRKLVVHEDDSITNFAWRIPRDQVIIEKKTLRKLSQKAGDSAAELKKTLRTWTDSTGDHKVEARFVRVADGKVTLKTDAGREIQLPLKRLSDNDQELLKGVGSASDNPFE